MTNQEMLDRINAVAAQFAAELNALREQFGQTADTKAPSAPRAIVALCVGHSRSGDDGAIAADKRTSEWDYNRDIARNTAIELKRYSISAVVIDSYGGSSYGLAMQDCGRQVKKAGAELAFELHFNCADGKASGYEFLYGTVEGKKLAQVFKDVFDHSNISKFYSRGLKNRASGDGSGFFRHTHCPAVILEPFFGDHPESWRFFSSAAGKQHLSEAYSKAIDESARQLLGK